MNAPLRRQGANAYAEVGMETGVEAASPHQLITMLFDGVIHVCKQAKVAMAAGNIPEKARLITHAMNIILLGLKTGLNMEAGGELAQNLAIVYDQLSYQLFMANAHNDPARLDHVLEVVAGLKEAWDQVPQGLQNQAQPVVAAPAALPQEMPPARPAKLYGSV